MKRNSVKLEIPSEYSSMENHIVFLSYGIEKKKEFLGYRYYVSFYIKIMGDHVWNLENKKVETLPEKSFISNCSFPFNPTLENVLETIFTSLTFLDKDYPEESSLQFFGFSIEEEEDVEYTVSNW